MAWAATNLWRVQPLVVELLAAMMEASRNLDRSIPKRRLLELPSRAESSITRTNPRRL